VYVPPIAGLFRFAPLGMAELATAALAGLAGVAWYEILKVLRR
jgi:hypothetical protein